MNPFNPDDPKYTAYILNELTEEQAAELEAEFERDPEAKAYADELFEAARALKTSLDSEPELKLDEGCKEKIRRKAGQPKNNPRILWPSLAAAAAVALAVCAHVLFPNPVRVETETATSPASDQVRDIDSTGTMGRLEESKDQAPPVGEESSDVKFSEPLDVAQEAQAPASTPARRADNTPKDTAGRDVDLDQSSPSALPAEGEVAEGVASGTETEDLSRIMSDISSPVKMTGLLMGRSAAGRSAAIPPSESSPPSPPPVISPSQDDFAPVEANKFQRVGDHPLSTFSIDVDTASYAVVRKFLNEGRLPPRDAVRVEEMINYFRYDYAPPADGNAFAAHMDIAACPWTPEHHLVRIGIKGREIPAEERPALNLVYLLDVSGSMNSANKLPLVKRSLQALVQQLDERDRVAIVVYAGAAGLVLPTTSGADSRAILEAIDRLSAGGSTAGGAGIQLAYQTAREQFVEDGVNRVILCTDGDFNVGLNQRGDLERLIEKEAESGVQLTVLGFGMGNYKDANLEGLSNKGNGNYGYIDDFNEARKLLVDQMLGTLVTIAKDVKIQVEFNPAHVAAYRLIGYENRMLRKEDFNNDKVDAGDIGAGHTVTALYELVPAGRPVPGDAPAVDELKYQAGPDGAAAGRAEFLTLKLRHKPPGGEVSSKQEFTLPLSSLGEGEPDTDHHFATAVAAFGLWLRDPEFREQLTLDRILKRAEAAKGEDRLGYRAEFLRLVRNAKAIPAE